MKATTLLLAGALALLPLLGGAAIAHAQMCVTDHGTRPVARGTPPGQSCWFPLPNGRTARGYVEYSEPPRPPRFDDRRHDPDRDDRGPQRCMRSCDREQESRRHYCEDWRHRRDRDCDPRSIRRHTEMCRDECFRRY